MSTDAGMEWSPKRWLLPLSLVLLIAVVLSLLFPSYWLNSDFVRRQLTGYAAAEGISLSYGKNVTFSWWRGIGVDRLRMETGDLAISLKDIAFMPGHHLNVAVARVRLGPALFANAQGNSSSVYQPPSAAWWSLVPEHIRVRQLNIAVPQGSYRGSLGLTVHGGMAVDATLQGQWHLQHQDRTYSGTMDTSLRLDLPKKHLEVSSFELGQADASVLIKGVSAELGDSPRASVASVALHCRVRPFAPLVARWISLPSRLQAIDVEGSRLRYGDKTMSLLLKRLAVEGEDGSRLELSGPLAWHGQQGNRVESSGLALRIAVPGAALWGGPAAATLRFGGKLRGSFDMADDGSMHGRRLAVQGVFQADDARWNCDMSADSVRMRDRHLLLDRAKAAFEGEKPLGIAGLHIRAGRYQVLLADSSFDFKDRRGIVWRQNGEADIAANGFPSLALHVASGGIRERHSTLIDYLKVNEKAQGVSAVLRGRLSDGGPDQRPSRLQGKLSVDRLSQLGKWMDGLEGVKGKGELIWKSEGLGRGKLDTRGEVVLSGGGLVRSGIALHGVALALPFRQRLDLGRMKPEQGRGINPADLVRLDDRALPGSLTIESLAAGGFRLNGLRLGLRYDEGELSGKVTAGEILDGMLAGYFQVAIPKDGRGYPDAFARLSLMQADTSRLSPGGTGEQSRLNLYGTIKSDGKDISGRLSAPDIQRKSMDDLIAWLATQGKEKEANSVKRMMDQFGFAPSSVDARLQNRYVDIDVVLHSRSGDEMKIPIHNLLIDIMH